MERVSDEWLNEAIPNYSAIDSKSKGANVYLALCELRERRQIEKERGELVVASTFLAIKTAEILRLLKNAEKEHGHTDHSASEKGGAEATQERERVILPSPVKNVDGVSVETWTVKQWFGKINEELDEFKESVLEWYNISGEIDCIRTVDGANIADKAADTITAITSMLEAMGIYKQARQEAQKRVNERNKERGRL